jgi:hypothetical protein
MHLDIKMSDILATFAPKDIQEQRLSICKECPKFKPTLHLCEECGCQMDAKTRLAYATCPLHKWLPVPQELIRK